jgi:hypothetical protein
VRSGLVEVHPKAFVAGTQPVDAWVLLRAMVAADGHREWAVMEDAALWVHGYGTKPKAIVVGVALTRRLAVRGPARTRRVADSVLEGGRVLKGVPVVSLEVALLQAAEKRTVAQMRELVEQAVRDRRTTLTRLRARRRRGLKGSAVIGRLCDELSGGSMEADVRRLKQALEARGVVGLETEVRFTSEGGGSAYADLLDRRTMTLVEVDGYLTHTVRETFRSDRRRDRWMRKQHEATTLRVDVMEIREDLDGLADELAEFFLDGPDEMSA